MNELNSEAAMKRSKLDYTFHYNYFFRVDGRVLNEKSTDVTVNENLHEHEQ